MYDEDKRALVYIWYNLIWLHNNLNLFTHAVAMCTRFLDSAIRTDAGTLTCTRAYFHTTIFNSSVQFII